jgi:hypothetical protein
MTCLRDCIRYSQSTEIVGEPLRIVRPNREMISCPWLRAGMTLYKHLFGSRIWNRLFSQLRY